MTPPTSSPLLIIGSGGQLGSAFRERLDGRRPMTAVGRAEIDVSNGDALRRLIDRVAPAVIVNCAAYNDVDGAEADPRSANQVNAEAVGVMAAAARDRSATLVYFSSDFVFDGRKPAPYTEDDEPNPISAYGASKLAGERQAAAAAQHYVLRLSSVYGGHTRRAFVDSILARLGSGERVPAFTDRYVSPSYVPEIVDATIALLDASAPSGTYHCGSSDFGSWHDLAAAIASRLGRSGLVDPIPFVPERHRARRPRNCAFASAKLAAFYRTRSWSDAIRDYMTRLADGRSS